MTTSTVAAALARTFQCLPFVVAAASCGGDDTVSPTRPVLVNRSPILFTSGRSGDFDIYVMEADGTGARPVTRTAGIDQSADWSPEGFKLAFMSRRDGDFDVYTIYADGKGLRQLTNGTGSDGFPRWSPNGSRLLFTSEIQGGLDLFVMNADGTNPVRLRKNVGENSGGAWSPDGSRIAFVSTQTPPGM